MFYYDHLGMVDEESSESHDALKLTSSNSFLKQLVEQKFVLLERERIPFYLIRVTEM